MTQTKSTNITWHSGKISKGDRKAKMGQRGVTIWLTGLSGSGKSTIAVELEHALIENNHHAYILDGDNVRHGLNKNLGFSPEDRSENIRRIGEVAKDGEFVEVYIKCPVEVCEERDVKGLYKKARAGEIKEFTGISAPYEEPDNAELVIDSSELSVEEATRKIIAYLMAEGFVSL